MAGITVDDYGNAKISAKKPGESIIVVETEGAKKEVKVNVTKSIESIDVDKTEVTVKQGSEENLKVTINPSNATADLKVESDNADIARIYYDEESKEYKIIGVAEGDTVIRLYSESNSNISKTVSVTVDKLELPKVTKIVVENSEEAKVLRAGDEIYLRVYFDGTVIGTVPNLKLKFGEYYSVNDTEYVEGLEKNTILRYKYTVAEGDNGYLMIEKLSGGELTDFTKQIKATTSQDNIIYKSTEGDTEDREYINDGVYEVIEEIEADTSTPSVKVITSIDKDSNWLKNGDEIKVKIVSEENLKGVPTVYFNEVKANVEGEGSVFTASLPVTGELSDGYLEIKVTDMVDTAGNAKETVIAKQDNINEPIIIDNSAPIISNINIKKETGKVYEAGEKFDIEVKFADIANITKEYITAEEAPTLNLEFGGKEAKGTITSNYTAGSYVQSITYTYTVSEEDKGEVTVESISGTVSDVAGNTSDLSKVGIMSSEKETPESTNQNDNTNKTNITNITKTPKTGDEITRYICIVLVVGIVLLKAEYCYRRNKRDK